MQNYIGSHQDTYGGEYANNAIDPPVLVLAFTRDVAARREELALIFPYPAQLDVVGVAHTQRELTMLTQRIAADWPRLRERGVDLRRVWPDIPHNVVAVGIANPTDEVKMILGKEYPGEPIAIIPDNSRASLVDSSRSLSRPLIAGCVAALLLVITSLLILWRRRRRSS